MSVIIPTYNRAHVLGRAIRSVLDQAYRDFEIIVVDDGSTDDTAQVIQSFDDPRITYCRYEVNRGAPAARNTGIRVAKGRFLAFQDSDDIWLAGKLAKTVEALQAAPPRVGVVYSAFSRRESDATIRIPADTVAPREGDLWHILPRGNFIGLPAALVRSQCFESVGGFDEEMPRFQDWELWLRVAEYYRFGYVDEVLVTSFREPDSISTDASALKKAFKLISRKHFPSGPGTGRRAADFYRYAGMALLAGGNQALGSAYLCRSALAYPPCAPSAAAVVFARCAARLCRHLRALAGEGVPSTNAPRD